MNDNRDLASKLWDIEQIKQLKARYFRFLDTKQWTEFRALFTDDWQWYAGEANEPQHLTPDAFVEWISGSHDSGRVLSAHQGHMPEIELTGERTAQGIWAMFDWVDHPQSRAFQGFGHYWEQYEKGDDGKWRIKTTRLTRLRTDQTPPGAEPNPNYPRGRLPENAAGWS
jgi:hypothetical protein